MKVIIAGSRTGVKYADVVEAVSKANFDITFIVSGKANGADTLGEIYAMKHNIKVIEFPAKWVLWGKSAGYRRNVEMAEYADALIAIWDGQSVGTKHMIQIATDKRLPVYIHYINRK